MNVKTTVLHEVGLLVTIDWPELKALIVREAIEKIDNHQHRALLGRLKLDDVRLVIHQLEEGSPSYRVARWSATVSASASIDAPQET